MALSTVKISASIIEAIALTTLIVFPVLDW
jgi:hypothetical protein